MKFKYSARTKEGELQSGYVDAQNKELALDILKGHDLYVLILVAERPPLLTRVLAFLPRITRKDLVILTRQLATMVESKLMLVESLKILADQSEKSAVKELLMDLSSDIEGGLTFSQALEKHADIFSPFYVNLIRSSEVTGRIEESLLFLADYLEKDYQLKNKIKTAMLYPAFILLIFLAVILILLTYVFPQLRPLFEEVGAQMPFSTRILLGFGDFIKSYGVVFLILLAIGVYLLRNYLVSKEGKTALDSFLLKIPGLGNFLRKFYIARFTMSLYILISGGIPAVQSLEISSLTIGSAAYQKLLHDAAEEVRRGVVLSSFTSQHLAYFPALVGAMINVGEKTGRLDEMLKRLSDFYTKEVDALSASLAELIQPIIMVAIGIFVGFLFASVLMPIYNLVQSF